MAIKTSIQIRFSDVDMARHVHNAAYLQYFEIGRMDLLRQVIGADHDWVRTGLILARNEVDYLIPIELSDRITVETTCLKLGHKSFTLSYAVTSMGKGMQRLHAKGSSVMVCFDYHEQQSIEIPSHWRRALEKLMEHDPTQQTHA